MATEEQVWGDEWVKEVEGGKRGMGERGFMPLLEDFEVSVGAMELINNHACSFFNTKMTWHFALSDGKPEVSQVK